MLSERDKRRHLEAGRLTVAQVAERGDTLRVHCLDCPRTRDVPAQSLVARHGRTLINHLKFSCSDCQRGRRKGVGLHAPGRATWAEILWPADRA